MIKIITLILLLLFSSQEIFAKLEVAFTFDDVPVGDSPIFTSVERAKNLVATLKSTKSPAIGIFVNPCKIGNEVNIIQALKIYTDASAVVGNHTCTHPDLNKIDTDLFISDAEKADQMLATIIKKDLRLFRFPYLHEGKDIKSRDHFRSWMLQKNYRNGYVTVDTDDWLVTARIREAEKLNHKIDPSVLIPILVDHIIGAIKYYDDLAIKTIGRSPKHVILLHEIDGTVLALSDIIKAIQKKGWNIISIQEAYSDKIYSEHPSNTFSNNGLVAQLAFEKNSVKLGYKDDLDSKLKAALNLHKVK